MLSKYKKKLIVPVPYGKVTQGPPFKHTHMEYKIAMLASITPSAASNMYSLDGLGPFPSPFSF